eukprot:2069939-Rhodomonas_salina.2
MRSWTTRPSRASGTTPPSPSTTLRNQNTRNRIPGANCTEIAVSCIWFRGVAHRSWSLGNFLPQLLLLAVLTRGTVLRVCYALCGTELGYAAVPGCGTSRGSRASPWARPTRKRLWPTPSFR